jgi:hypothetical protein
MLKQTKIEIAIGLAVLATAAIWLVLQVPLPGAPGLNAALRASPLHYKLLQASVADVELVCRDGKVDATFSFWQADGRSPVTVAGSEHCSRSGTLVHWAGFETRAREAYDPAMVISQLDILWAKSGITKNPEERNNKELGALLDNKFQAQVSKAHVEWVLFSCKEAGDTFRYLAKYGVSDKFGEVSTRCQRDHEEFTVVPKTADPLQPDGIAHGYVHQYRKLDPAMVEQAYGQFLATPLKTSF